MGFAGCSHGVYEHVPHCQISQEITLLLRAPRASAENVVENHTAVDAVSLSDGFDSIRTEGASAMCQLPGLVSAEMARLSGFYSSLGIDISHLASCSTLIFGKLSGNAQRVAELGLTSQLLLLLIGTRSQIMRQLTLPVLNSPNTSVMLCVLIPPPRIASTALAPVEIRMTIWRRSEISVAEMKAGGYNVSWISYIQRGQLSLTKLPMQGAR